MCCFIYGLLSKDMDEDQREKFDYDLNDDHDATLEEERNERREQAKRHMEDS